MPKTVTATKKEMPLKSRKRWKFGRTGIAVLLFLALALSITSLLVWTPSNSELTSRSGRSKTQAQFTVLNSKSNNELNVLEKPFQWYRDHWSSHVKNNDNATTGKPWEQTELPSWMKDYFEWHENQTRKRSKTNGIPAKYLVVQCLEQDKQCGGLADRLLSLPFYILLAAQTKRILIIVWTVPFPLEEFFIPNGFDWRLPSSFHGEEDSNKFLSAPSIKDKTVFSSVSNLIQAASRDNQQSIVRARVQDYATAWKYYDQHQQQQHASQESGKTTTIPFAMQHYRELFSVLFQPSPPLQQAVQQQKIPTNGTYAVAHYRALYGSSQPPRAFIRAAAKNAANCASQLFPSHSIYVLSDSIEALQSLLDYRPGVVIPVMNDENSNPQHLDKATRKQKDSKMTKETKYKPSDFYSIFLDVLLMAGAQCVSYGQGGFGKLGSLLSRNNSCTSRHFDKGRMVSCLWKRH